MAGVLEKRNNAAGGVAGQPVTLATSGGGSGTPFDRLILPNDVGAGNTFNFDTSVTPPTLPAGTQWYLLDQPATGAVPQLLAFWWTKPTPRTVWTLEWEMRIERMPAVSMTMWSWFSDPGWLSSSILGAVSLNSSGTMFVRNSNAADTVGNSSNTAAVALNTSYTCQLLVDYTALAMTLNIFAVGGTTVLFTATKTVGVAATVSAIRGGLGTANTGTTGGARIRFTNIREGYNGVLARIDTANTAPTITTTVNAIRTYLAGSAVDFPVVATDGTSVTSLVPSFAAVPAGASTPTFADAPGGALTGIGTTTASRTSRATLPSPGTYLIQQSASDGTTTVVKQFEIRVFPPDGVACVVKSVTKGSFVVVGSTNDDAGAKVVLTDGSAVTLLDSGVTPTNMVGSIQVDAIGVSGIDIIVGANVVNGGTLKRTWTVYKRDHTTVVTTIIQAGITAATGDVTLSLDANALGIVAVTNENDLDRIDMFFDWSDTIS